MNAECEMRNAEWKPGRGNASYCGRGTLRAVSLRNAAPRSTPGGASPAKPRRRGAQQSPHSALRNGFTLVELLLAWVVLALVVLLVAGVGGSVQDAIRTEQTRALQRTVLRAVLAYADHAGQAADPDAFPPGTGQPGSSGDLYRALRSDEQAGRILRELPDGAVRDAEIPRGEQTHLMEVLVDAFGRELRYDRTGGFAGQQPVLISLGPDASDAADDIETELMDIDIQRQQATGNRQ